MSVEEGLRTFRVWVSYDGSDFSGFQEQPGQATVQASIKTAIEVFCKGPYRLNFAGRTDAGVHARGQALSLQMATKLDLRQIVLAFSHGLPSSIRVTRVDEVPFDFNPKRHAIGKRYVYRVWNALASDPFSDKYMWHVRRNINPQLMSEAAEILLGEHDYESFRSAGCEARHARRYIWEIAVTKRELLIEIDIRGNAFCQNMVRIIAGTLVEVGIGKRLPSEMINILAGRDRTLAGRTAPAKGLTLEEVYYPDHLGEANIPADAQFPRYPVTDETWPFENEQIKIGQS